MSEPRPPASPDHERPSTASPPVTSGGAGVARTYAVRTFGCQMNEHDSERIAGLLEQAGYQAATDPEAADVVVLNTCTIRENADNRLYGNLGHLKRLKDARPGMQIAVGGCAAQKDRDLVRQRAPWVDVVFGTHNVSNVAQLLDRAAANGPVVEILDEAAEFASALPVVRDVEWSAWVTIQIGCNNTCAFCIVPAVRGQEVSRPFDEIVEEVRALAANGVTEVTLLGQNVNSYGRDLTKRRPLFAELLRAVGAVEGIRRVRFTSPHPKDLRPETIAAMAETPTAAPHLHYPLQSGSDRVLAAMHRGYTAERYLAKLADARQAIAGLAVTTDIIVGFPGETEADFERTLEVAATAEYDSAYTFQFSPRPGTEAAALVDQFVSPEVVADRFERLRVVVERSALAKHQAKVGAIEEVLVEGPSRKDPSLLSGRTADNKLVHFEPPQHRAVPGGTYGLVEVTSAAPHHLLGRLLSITAAPRHRRRIPVAAL